jgi:hypothetical protein
LDDLFTHREVLCLQEKRDGCEKKGLPGAAPHDWYTGTNWYFGGQIVSSAGYSGTPLAKKLGIKEGFSVVTVNAPDNFEDLLCRLPVGASIKQKPTANLDLIHLFTNNRDELAASLAKYKNLIKQNGTIWVSWYKKAAKMPTEITEDVIREVALPLGLVDVKVCAVDDKWSGLKLVIRRENRV